MIAWLRLFRLLWRDIRSPQDVDYPLRQSIFHEVDDPWMSDPYPPDLNYRTK